MERKRDRQRKTGQLLVATSLAPVDNACRFGVIWPQTSDTSVNAWRAAAFGMPRCRDARLVGWPSRTRSH